MSSESADSEKVEGLDGRRVLVVDDDRALLHVLTAGLEHAGCTVEAFDRFEAAKKYLMSADAPDLLVTDLRLGEFNGLQLAVICRQRHPTTRIVVMTGYDDVVLQKDAEFTGASYLVKPVAVSDLIQVFESPPPGA
jgi:DNA-binding NtrC family response regulator